MTATRGSFITRLFSAFGGGRRPGGAPNGLDETLLGQFAELHFQPDPAGQRRFVWKLPAQWPVPEDPFDLGRISDEDAFWLHVAIWACLPQWRPAGLDVATREGRLLPASAARFIYKTNAERSRKARVHYQPLAEAEGAEQFLSLQTRRTRGPSVCPNCQPSLSAFVPSSASHCAGCGASADERQDFTEELFADLRKMAGVR